MVFYRWLQNYLVQASYWHNPLKEEAYRSSSSFLADINNERTINQAYIDNLKRLNKCVFVVVCACLIGLRSTKCRFLTFFFYINGIFFYCLACGRFVLVKFRQDTIVQPIETEWFQFYTPNQDQVIQPLAESSVAVSVPVLFVALVHILSMVFFECSVIFTMA